MSLHNVTLHVPPKNKLSGRLDVLMMVSGFLLAVFVGMHMLFVGSVILSPSLMNGLAWFFEELYLVQIGGPLILLVMIGHFILGARKMPFRQKEYIAFRAHSKMMHHQDTTLWLVQVATAIIILVMASIHIYTMLDTLPITAAKSAARIQHGSWMPFYIVLLAAAAIHIVIGLYRIGAKIGFVTRANRPAYRKYMVYLLVATAAISFLTHVRLSLLSI
ncbi:succinate dehydrogenase/fumarate reductase cytochrome b subunit [Desulfovibrio subterraneus]|jgi:fumarate reductase subunit C|uniref:Fumarate reductase cytochrome b subunit n=1 Tax=Desulfovibrio subterraneus TaxID=2718620 RepID=A0A7J0BMV5_9BACT|nr:succinate dehydrogenase/fumarate reductase cytochrome b subunit [Desulfovibrio subterraneus]WBF66458.1 succinate dehydrogenase/fumarate reductase cytochrome b subunit [Desulfovibrio subterraneus]GFM34581.1 hypothetical protein DSM101010T_29460 [Desulfovibrio subterraneus]